MATSKAPESGYRSGELARLTGVSSDTLRHYERLGILPRPARGPNGYRIYPLQAARRVALIQTALDMGLTLRELAQVLRVRDAGGAPCRTVRELGAKKLREVELQIERYKIYRSDLRRVLRDWDRRLEGMPRGGRAGLLDALSEAKRARPRNPDRNAGTLRNPRHKERTR
jgi:DNA-binding transcriptional MerR regulator